MSDDGAPVPPVEEEPGSGRKRRRRRRTRAERRRGFVTLLPQLLTTGNLGSGFFSITLTVSERYEAAALAIFVAVLFDIADGRVARMARATSKFGAEYDSIADTVSFGVAPALLAYGAGGLSELGWTGWVLAFSYTAGASLRLARFNVSPGRYRGRFDGLASPAGAGMVLSTVWFGALLREWGTPVDLPVLLAGLGVAGLGALMVSPIPYYSFKEMHLRGNYGTTVLMVFTVIGLILEPQLTFFIFGLGYVASGPMGILWRQRTGRVLEEVAPQSAEQPVSEAAGSGSDV